MAISRLSIVFPAHQEQTMDQRHASIAEDTKMLLNQRYTIDASAADNRTLLMRAVMECSPDFVELLVQVEADINAVVPIGGVNRSTCLIMAVAGGKYDIVTLLVEGGANVNVADDKGWTPLMAAAQHGHSDIALYLLMAGSEVNAQDEQGMTPLMAAALLGRLNLSRILIEFGAKADITDAQNLKAYDYAVNHIHILRLLW